METDVRPNVTLSDALAAAEERFRRANPKSHALHQDAQRAMPGGNTRTVLHYDPFPLRFAEGKGAHLIDVDGHDYLDLLGEYSAGLYGHSEPAIIEAVEAALKGGVVLGGPNCMEARFAATVCDRFPAIDRVRFCNSGTEANLLAIGAARAFTEREHIIVMRGAYHGGVLYFEGDCPINVPFPHRRIGFNDVAGAAEAIRSAGDTLAAVVVEPMMGGGGCLPASREFLDCLRAETEAVGALLIFDEVMTSRMSVGGVHGLYGLRPDLVTLGKYVGGGMSFGAFGGRHDIMDRFNPHLPGAWPHAGTFNNNVLTMAAGEAGLTKVLTAERLADLNRKGELLRAEMETRVERLDLPVRITGMGSLTAFHFTRRPVNAPEDLPAVPAELKALVHLDLIACGYYLARRGMITLSLPVTDAEITGFADAFEEALSTNAGVIQAAMKDLESAEFA